MLYPAYLSDICALWSRYVDDLSGIEYVMALSVWRVSMRGYYGDDLMVAGIDIPVLDPMVDLCDLLLD